MQNCSAAGSRAFFGADLCGFALPDGSEVALKSRFRLYSSSVSEGFAVECESSALRFVFLLDRVFRDEISIHVGA